MEQSYQFIIDNNPKQSDLDILSKGLTDHALPITQTSGFKKMAVLMRDSGGAVVGGVWGYINWNWLHVSLLWLAPVIRGKGYGKRLMEIFEDKGKKEGCTKAHLDTFSFQARPFYESLGYEVFATLEDYPTGHTKYYMKKELRD